MGVSILTGKTSSNFHTLIDLSFFYLKITKFTVSMPAYKERPHAKIEVNRSSHFRDTSVCSSSFRTNRKISSNSQARILILGTFVGCIKENSGTNLVKIQQSFTELQTFICIIKDQTLNTLTG